MTGDSARRFLTALQLADSFFPSGMYAHSHGLESMVSRGWVNGAREVREYLRNLLVWSVLPSDGVALVNARAAAQMGDLATASDIDRHLYSMKLPVELRLASRLAGRRILDEMTSLLTNRVASSVCAQFRQMVAHRDTPGTGAVALGVVAHAAGIDDSTALLAFCHSFAVGVLGAAQRLLPLTHSEAQQILYSLHEPVAEMVAKIETRHWLDMTSFTPQADIASMLHEHDEVRMFAS